MFDCIRLRRIATAASLLAALALAPDLHAAGARLDRPVTDATGAPSAAPGARLQPPAVFAPRVGARLVDPTNPMGEIAPGIYEGIDPVQLPDGTWLVLLDERFLQFSVARRAAAGGFTSSCVSGLDGLARWRSATPACTHAAAMPAAVQPTLTTATGTVVTKWEER